MRADGEGEAAIGAAAAAEAGTDARPGPRGDGALSTDDRIEVAWLFEGRTGSLILPWPEACGPFPTVGAVLSRDDVRAVVPPVLLAERHGLSVYGRKRRLTDPVVPGDRIEIVPPLLVDPKLRRRRDVDERRRAQRRDRWHTA